MAPSDPLEPAKDMANIVNDSSKIDLNVDEEKAKMLELESLSSSEDEHEAPDIIADQITSIIGKHGLWHWMIWIVTGLSIIIHGWQSMANKFLTHNTDHWCARPDLYSNLSLQEWANISSPILTDGQFDRCNIYDFDYSNSGIQRPDESWPTIPCTRWEYVAEHFQVIRPIVSKVFSKWQLCFSKSFWWVV